MKIPVGTFQKKALTFEVKQLELSNFGHFMTYMILKCKSDKLLRLSENLFDV